MKIISGQAKGYPLLVPKGEVRPTQDRVREALFNILTPILPGARVLDLFCGTGSVGLEALSRGAARACMVDASRASCNTARENMKRSRLSGGTVVQADCQAYVQRDRGQYDLICADLAALRVRDKKGNRGNEVALPPGQEFIHVCISQRAQEKPHLGGGTFHAFIDPATCAIIDSYRDR